MHTRSRYLVIGFLGCLVSLGFQSGSRLLAVKQGDDQLEKPTHRQVRLIHPKLDGESVTMHSMSSTKEGLIAVALGGASMQYEMKEDGSGYSMNLVEQPAAVLLLDHEGKEVQRFDVPITPTALAIADDNTIYVGGSGKVCRISADGEIGEPVDSPHVGNRKKLRKATIQAIKDSRQMMSGSFDEQIDMLRGEIEKIEDKDEDDRSRLEESQLKAFQMQLEAIEVIADQQGGDEESLSEDEIEAAMQQALSITSMAVSDKDLFICASSPSYSYNVWRMDRDLSDDDEPTKVLTGLSGCCGQMDIQCCDDKLVVSENTRFKVAIYDRNGEPETDFGERDRTSRSGFGSCCNPMNSLPLDDGSIVTAESSIGHIKRFDREGNLVAYVGKAKIGGGCKHCSLGYNADEDLYFMMYQDKNAICVLANIESAPITDSEKQLLARRDTFFSRAVGRWSHESVAKEEKSGGIWSSLFGGGRGSASPYPVAAIEIQPDGKTKILAGMYQAYGDESELELMGDDEVTPSEDKVPSKESQDDLVHVALAIDQVRFAEGTWRFESADEVELTFAGMDPITLHRKATDSCGSACGADGCKDGQCANPDCDNAESQAEPVVAAYERQMLTEAMDDLVPVEDDTVVPFPQSEGAIGIFDSTVLKTKWEYRLISPADLEDASEARLNELGGEGWEYCGRLGEKMMFKRVGDLVVEREGR